MAAHKWMKRIPVDLLDSLLRFTGGDARGTLSVDSTRYTFNRHVLVEDARRGKFYRKATVKHHTLITDSGRIVAVTDGNAGDSPALARLCARAPRGKGYLLGDSAYCFRGDCRLAASIGRQPCFRPEKGFVARGMGEWGRCWPGVGTIPAASMVGSWLRWLPFLTNIPGGRLDQDVFHAVIISRKIHPAGACHQAGCIFFLY